MVQNLIVGGLFLGAVAFLGKAAWSSFKPKKNTVPSCAKCAANEKGTMA